MAIRQKICMGFNFVFCITYLHDLIAQARSFLAPGRGPERPTCNEEAGALKVKGPVGGGRPPREEWQREAFLPSQAAHNQRSFTRTALPALTTASCCQ